MPDIATSFGFMQSIGLGFGLLAFLTLRARRYGADVAKSYIPVWLTLCIGLAIYSVVEVGLDAGVVALRLLIIFVLPTLGALALRKMMLRRQR